MRPQAQRFSIKLVTMAMNDRPQQHEARHGKNTTPHRRRCSASYMELPSSLNLRKALKLFLKRSSWGYSLFALGDGVFAPAYT